MHGNQWVLKIAVLKYYSVSKRGTTAKSNPKQATDPISLHTKFGDNSSNTFPLNERKPCVTPDIGRRTPDIGHRTSDNGHRTSDGEKSKNNISTPQGGGHKYCHVTPFLHKLHSLPIHYRILFKYNLLTYKAIHFSQPLYLSSLIRWSDLTRSNRLAISTSRPNKRSGLRSFTVGAPTEWNKLPQAIRIIESISGFRKQLKTHLFRLAYPPP